MTEELFVNVIDATHRLRQAFMRQGLQPPLSMTLDKDAKHLLEESARTYMKGLVCEQFGSLLGIKINSTEEAA